jgi:hypothetical protein
MKNILVPLNAYTKNATTTSRVCQDPLCLLGNIIPYYANKHDSFIMGKPELLSVRPHLSVLEFGRDSRLLRTSLSWRGAGMDFKELTSTRKSSGRRF